MEVKESTGINGLENAFNDTMDYLEAENLGDINDTTPIFILMSKNGTIIDNSFGIDVKIFTGGTLDEVVANLQLSLKK